MDPSSRYERPCTKYSVLPVAIASFWEFGSACWARTSDPLINSQLLYQLS